MNEYKLIKDEAALNFNSESEMLKAIQQLQSGDEISVPEWFTVDTNGVRFIAMTDCPEAVEAAAFDDVFADTFTHTGIVVLINGRRIPLRLCALKSVLKRAQVGGESLTRVTKQILADILNKCIETCKGSSLVRTFEGKLSALLSSDYVPLDQRELFAKVKNALEPLSAEFDSGWIDHTVTIAKWKIRADNVVEAYETLLDTTGVDYDSVTPVVRFTTSDIGESGANLFPSFVIRKGGWDTTIPLISKLSVEHKGASTMEDFDKNLQMLLPTFEEAVHGLEELSALRINNPQNAFLGVAKVIGVPKKYAFRAWEQFDQTMIPGEPVTAYDLYAGLSEVLFFMEYEDHEDAPKIAGMSEIIARASQTAWKDYDTSIAFKW